MDKLNRKELEQIPIPEGLEQRLSDRIDQWDAMEKRSHFRWKKWVAVAACTVLVAGAGTLFLTSNAKSEVPAKPTIADTYTNPELAKEKTEWALNLLAYNMERGIKHLEKASYAKEKAEQMLNKYLTTENL